MLGESDLVYTETVCAMDSESFEGKEVLILGGGDGGILHELRKQNPRNIIMAEVRACNMHPLQSISFTENPVCYCYF